MWDAARDAVYAMPEFVEEEREDATMDVEETAERAYRRAQAAADDALVAATMAAPQLEAAVPLNAQGATTPVNMQEVAPIQR